MKEITPIITKKLSEIEEEEKAQKLTVEYLKNEVDTAKSLIPKTTDQSV